MWSSERGPDRRRAGSGAEGGRGLGRASRTAAVLAVALVLLATGCGTDSDTDDRVGDTAPGADPGNDGPAGTTEPTEAPADAGSTGGSTELYPDVVEARAERQADGTWAIDATLTSPYDTPERYADAWRVVGPDGEVYGIRELAHDHAAEQPFTRSLRGVEIPDGVERVVIEGRDQVSGWGGQTVTIELER